MPGTGRPTFFSYHDISWLYATDATHASRCFSTYCFDLPEGPKKPICCLLNQSTAGKLNAQCLGSSNLMHSSRAAEKKAVLFDTMSFAADTVQPNYRY